MRSSSLALFLIAAASSPAVSQQSLNVTDRAAIAEAVQHLNDRTIYAWLVQDASRIVPASDPARRTDLQREMDRTVQVDSMVERLDSLRTTGPAAALAYTTRRLVRQVRLPDGREMQRTSIMTLERPLVRRDGVWVQEGVERGLREESW